MHVKDLLDDLDIRVKLPQHWYSTDISNDFEDAELLQNDEIIKIETVGEKNTKLILPLTPSNFNKNFRLLESICIAHCNNSYIEDIFSPIYSHHLLFCLFPQSGKQCIGIYLMHFCLLWRIPNPLELPTSSSGYAFTL